MTIQEVINRIHQMTLEEAKQVERAAEMRREYMTRATIRIGDAVWFDAGPRRGRIQGTVEKINTKRYVIQTATGRWNVSPEYLNKMTQTATA